MSRSKVEGMQVHSAEGTVSGKASGRRKPGKAHGPLWEAELAMRFENEFQPLFKNKTKQLLGISRQREQ